MSSSTLLTARSWSPSPSKSAAAGGASGRMPTGSGLVAGWVKFALPLFFRIVTSLEPWFSTARSWSPSPLTSTAVIPCGKVPAFSGLLATCVKLPEPPLLRMLTLNGLLVGDREVHVRVAVELRRRQRDDLVAGRFGTRRGLGEVPGPVVTQDRHGPDGLRRVGDRQVLVAVTVDVERHRHDRDVPARLRAGRRLVEAARAVVLEDGDVVTYLVGNRQVLVAVTVEIGRGDPGREVARRRARARRVEPTGAVVLQDRDVAAGDVDRREVDVEVTVEIGRDCPLRVDADRHRASWGLDEVGRGGQCDRDQRCRQRPRGRARPGDVPPPSRPSLSAATRHRFPP